MVYIVETTAPNVAISTDFLFEIEFGDILFTPCHFTFAFYQSAALLYCSLYCVLCVFHRFRWCASPVSFSVVIVCACVDIHTPVWFGVVGGRQVDVINGYIFFSFFFFGFLFQNIKKRQVSFSYFFFFFWVFVKRRPFLLGWSSMYLFLSRL